uniref:Recombination repair protein 1 n=1 Tax=Drosophila melanogaster TaxID=7227 RepID=RRP1_DROME|nr:recombination repair protein 1, isoform A [Drosophila melanogaster]P27864.2 RecName: Full=Recombination repair protein 1; AltName: Full=DNA-(apurinic or apyrimidinic site) endonuclease [Drosophila melanogaster]AAF51175.1 recombination repair protein 1, isoform A [Drosophila melanogaster]AAM49974.1 LP05366p [Drosophila melanogaster]|eukprot:NP_476841.1 recombination repair protein 1, isoform A [Drosophila melanogaster]
MPRVKAVKKQAEALASEPTDPTPNANGNGVDENADSAAEELKVPAKGKPRARKATKTAVSAENSEEVEPQKAPTAAARGKKKQPKDTDENGQMEVVAKPKGRAKKATAEAEPEPKVDLPAGKATKPRAKKEPTPAPDEVTSSPPKGRAKAEKPTNAQAKGRKRKELPAEANGGAEEAAEPPKQRARKEAVPTLKEQAEPGTISKEKVQKAETAAKRARGTKRLADSEIAAALDEPEVDEVPPKAASKRAKKGKMVEPSPETVGDFQSVQEEVESPPKTAAAPKKRAKKTTNGETAVELEPKTKAKPTKQRAKKEGKEPAPGKKQKKSADKENGVVEEEAKPSTETKPAKGRKKAPVKAEDVEDIEEAAEESKPARGRKKAAAKAEEPDVDEESGSKTTKKAKKAETKTTVTLDKDAFALPADKEFNLKICSWNVAGLRAWLKKDGLQLIDLEEPDIFCLQETKCANDQLPEEVTRLPGYHPYWLCMPGGYAGVAIYSKIMPIHVEYGIGNEEFDDVGRMITAEYEKFYLINVYVPNSGRKLVNLEPRMRWEKLFQAYVKKLDALKPVVICGDMNVSHMPIDLENPKNNTKNAGFTQEERDKMTELLGLGFVDTFRHLYPDRKGAYTFWTYMANARARNVGWRLDYCLVSERFVPKVVEHEIRSQCLGSDHCPITIFFNI